jgi:hypothetical protein
VKLQTKRSRRNRLMLKRIFIGVFLVLFVVSIGGVAVLTLSSAH